MGTQQSGELDLKIADLAKDGQLVSQAREYARKILQEDPFLELTKNHIVKEQLRKVMKAKPNWSQIS
jgi:ATP-dependent DNA helicase RecG